MPRVNNSDLRVIQVQISSFEKKVCDHLDRINGKLDDHEKRIRTGELKQAKITTEFKLDDLAIENLEEKVKSIPNPTKAIRFWSVTVIAVVAVISILMKLLEGLQ